MLSIEMFQLQCGVCHFIIYSGGEVRSPKDILKLYNYRCRRCGARLSLESFEVDVSKKQPILQSEDTKAYPTI